MIVRVVPVQGVAFEFASPAQQGHQAFPVQRTAGRHGDSREFEQGTNQNALRRQDIDKVVATYVARQPIEKYAALATDEEIEANDFNLNIPRYVEPKSDAVVLTVDEADSFVDAPTDDHTLAGPATIAVTAGHSMRSRSSTVKRNATRGHASP